MHPQETALDCELHAGVVLGRQTPVIEQKRTIDLLDMDTTVLNGFDGAGDLKELLPVLTAAQHGSQMRDSARGHCKRVFVGMSRLSHLLCLAISAEHIADAQITALATNGWKIEKIRA